MHTVVLCVLLKFSNHTHAHFSVPHNGSLACSWLYQGRTYHSSQVACEPLSGDTFASEQSGVECACVCVLRIVKKFCRIFIITYNITVCAVPVEKYVARNNRDLYCCEPPKICPLYTHIALTQHCHITNMHLLLCMYVRYFYTRMKQICIPVQIQGAQSPWVGSGEGDG